MQVQKVAHNLSNIFIEKFKNKYLVPIKRKYIFEKYKYFKKKNHKYDKIPDNYA